MGSKYPVDVSVSLSIFYLKACGFWFAVGRGWKCFRGFLTIYTAFTVVFPLANQIRSIYFCWADYAVSTFLACSVVGLCITLSKFCIISIRKKKFFQLIEFMQKNIWHSNYDFQEKQIIAGVRKMCTYLVCTFSCSSQFTAVCYCVRPAIANIGKNESDRIFIFPMWLEDRCSETPYFEVAYVIQALILFQSDVSYLCFDNIFCIMCLHAAGQFRIVQHRMANIHKAGNARENNENSNQNLPYLSEACFVAFKDCIRQHQALIKFCTMLDEMFREIMLLQVLTFSILVCLCGYQLFLVDLPFSIRVSIIFFLSANICQLWMFTYGCDTMTRESLNVARAVYEAPWLQLPTDKFGKMIRKDIQFVMIRSRRACQITAWFFVISLETYTRIMSTAMSYFTLLKESTT